jgi:hypothetical protein
MNERFRLAGLEASTGKYALRACIATFRAVVPARLAARRLYCPPGFSLPHYKSLPDELFPKPGWFWEKLPKKRSNRTKARFFI